jgi:GNAT superfamily N-acetyltransferase
VERLSWKDWGVWLALHQKWTELYGETTPHVTKIRKSCKVERLHPDLIKYVPSTPPTAYLCSVDAGITGRSVGLPEWGYVATISYDYQPNENVGYIELVHVWEEFRRKGYGKLLVDAAVEEMKRHNIKTVYTAPVRLGSREFFTALGFKPFKNTPLFYQLLSETEGALPVFPFHRVVRLDRDSLKAVYEWLMREAGDRDLDALHIDLLLDPSMTYEDAKKVLKSALEKPLSVQELNELIQERMKQAKKEIEELK